MVRKLLLIVGLVVFLGFSLPVSAADLAPEYNPLCWKEKDCERVRKEFDGSAKPKEGFIKNDPPCSGGEPGNEWGKCLPSTVATTEIAFGGEKRFLNIGDFIIKNYNFAISIASVLAAVVVVMAGFQWATSGGNADTISSAKGKISGAVIGLFIAYTSYAILHTINPNLVNFRLPQTWMLRPISELPKYCLDAPSDTNFHLVADSKNQTSTIDTTVKFDNYEVPYSKMDYPYQQNCGARYVSDKSGSFTCFGSACSDGGTCINIDFSNTAKKDYHCERAVSVYGEVVGNYLTDLRTGGYEYDPGVLDQDAGWFDEDGSTLYRVCLSDDNKIILDNLEKKPQTIEDEQNKITYFKYDLVFLRGFGQQTEPPCSEGKILGYAVSLEVNPNWDSIDFNLLLDRNGNDLGGPLNKLYEEGKYNFESIPSSEILLQKKDLEKGYRMYIDVSKFKTQKY